MFLAGILTDIGSPLYILSFIPIFSHLLLQHPKLFIPAHGPICTLCSAQVSDHISSCVVTCTDGSDDLDAVTARRAWLNWPTRLSVNLQAILRVFISADHYRP
jgi:hypothetical protein